MIYTMPVINFKDSIATIGARFPNRLNLPIISHRAWINALPYKEDFVNEILWKE